MSKRRYLALSVQTPGVFALALCGAFLAFSSAQPIAGVCLLLAAAGCAAMWLLLLR